MTPKKLRDDAIVEALCQVTFSAAHQLPEILIGRLSDFGPGYAPNRLPLADVPPAIRRADPNLRDQPILELRKQSTVIRVGERVLSAHVTGVNNYPGWVEFLAQLQDVFGELFKRVPEVKVEGITLRYVNAIVARRHYIGDVLDLQLTISVGEKPFRGPVNLNLIETIEDKFTVTTRIAHPKFVQGQLPVDTTAIVDVEVSNGPGAHLVGAENVWSWLKEAHEHEKEAFFRLIPKGVLPRLMGESNA